MPSAVHIFNQYYWDLLKKVKNLARDFKYKSDDNGAGEIIREIKRSYLSFDKLAEEHLVWYKEHAGSFEEFLDTNLKPDDTVSSIKEWNLNDDVCNVELYKGIRIGAITRLFRNTNVVLYYLVLLSVFGHSMSLSEHSTQKIVELLRKKQPWANEDIYDGEFTGAIQLRLKVLRDILPKETPQSSNNIMDELENTSLGRLAKEIMNDVNVEEISKSIGDEGDILKALSNPDGGITKLLGTVSQKMIAKLASGELKQDMLMQDAMKLAGSLPNLTGGNKGSGGLADMASMMDQIGKMATMFGGSSADGDDAPDLSSMMSQFSNMMGGGMKAGNSKGTRTTVNQAAVNRVVRSKQLRRKLEERRRKHEEQ